MKKKFIEDEFNKAKSTDLLTCECYHCGSDFSTTKKLINYELKHKRGRIKYCSPKCKTADQKTSKTLSCTNCGTEFNRKPSELKKSNNYFCSKSCAATYNNKLRCGKVSYKKKEKIPNLVTITCINCGNTKKVNYSKRNQKFCSRSCSTTYQNNNTDRCSRGGIKSAKIQKEVRRSKNEILMYELCYNHFNNVLANPNMFNGWDADIVLTNHKIAIMWNGKWHYEKITEKHSVKQVQNRDKIKINEITKAGYVPYVIKDMGKHNPSFVNDEFNKLLEFIQSLRVPESN